MAMNLDKATVEELRTYARNELGINPPPGLTKDALRKVIQEAVSEALPDDDSVQTVSPAKPAEATSKVKRKRIMIHKTGDKTGADDVILGVNGRMYQIKRGMEVDVPASVVEVLKNAVEDRFEYHADPRLPGGGEMVKRQALAYPFSVIG